MFCYVFTNLMDAESVVLVNVTVDLFGRYFVGVREGSGQHCQQKDDELGCRLHRDSESTEMMANDEEGVDQEHTAGKQDTGQHYRTIERCHDVICKLNAGPCLCKLLHSPLKREGFLAAYRKLVVNRERHYSAIYIMKNEIQVPPI